MSHVPYELLAQQSKRFIECLEKRAFFEAHEALEAIWFDLRFIKEDEVVVLKAFINAAVSFELFKRKRAKSALKPWGYYLKHLHKYEYLEPKVQDEYKAMMHPINKYAKEFGCVI